MGGIQFQAPSGEKDPIHHHRPDRSFSSYVSYVLIFRQIDSVTVDSYYVRLSDAYWIEPHYRKELPRVGIVTLDDLLSKTKTKKDKEELALRLLVPKEQLTPWIEKAELAQLKGLGIENLRDWRDRVSIPSRLSQRKTRISCMRECRKPRSKTIPPKSKIRIWVRKTKSTASKLRLQKV